MILDLLGGTYEQRFADWNSQRTINWHPRVSRQQEKNKTQLSLVPRPGLKEFVDLGGDSIRGIFTARTLRSERCFAIVSSGESNTLYEIHYDGSSTSRGSLTNLTNGTKSKVYAKLNNNSQLMIQDASAAYIFDLTDNSLSAVTDYPGGTTLDYVDGYFIIADNNGRVSFSELGSGTSWSALDFFTPTSKPDKVKSVVVFKEVLYCFGDESIEVYINDGTSPFIRQTRSSIHYGLAAKDSTAVWQGGIVFMGKGATGGTEVYNIGSDLSIKPLSTPAIVQMINEHTNEDAEAFVTNTPDGHVFYHLHLPSLKTTLVYDFSTDMWHERQSERPSSDVDGTKPQDMYRGKCHARFKGLNLFGDWYSGKVFLETTDVSTDDGKIRKLTRISPIFHKDLKYISVYEMQLDANSGFGTTTGQGVDPILMFSYSLNGGNTFEPEQFLKLGPLGEYDSRVKINKLGTARNWVIKFTITDPVDITIMQAMARGVFGSW